jgi:deoxyribodipyrimidine photo-lyase
MPPHITNTSTNVTTAHITTNITTIVWFKRDLRVADHAPLFDAASSGAVLPLYVVEPSIFNAPDFAHQHWGFIRESLVELNRELTLLGTPLIVRVGEICDVLAKLQLVVGKFDLVSHQETGNALTYQRDIAVGKWCRESGVRWREFRQHGVARGLIKRDGWARQWHAFMSQPLISEPLHLEGVRQLLTSQIDLANSKASKASTASPADCNELKPHGIKFTSPDKPSRMQGGRANGVERLISFLDDRGQYYRREMSSPISAADACSRLSPHIAYGTLSLREIVHALHARRRALNAMTPDNRPEGMLLSLKSFESRLHWHCHFIQKLESEPAIETRNVHRGFDNIRNEGALDDDAQQKYAAWAQGKTGYPMIDACMRMLNTTGWINFRMRAMLMSFASYQLWLHWQHPALHLAREFLDYEPGIHYPQSQMQSGVTGINTIRIYNPIKQAHDQDPDGTFVKQWLPELANVPAGYIFEPWTMPPTLQAHVGVVIGVNYPAPIVDNVDATRFAREAIYAVKQQASVKQEAKKVYEKHGSRQTPRDGNRVEIRDNTKKKTLKQPQHAEQPQLSFNWE